VSIQVESETAGGGSGGSGAFPVELFTDTAKVLDLGSNKKFFVMDNAVTQTVLIPDNADEALPIGAEIDFIREGVGSVNFLASGAAVVQSRDNLFSINAQYSAVSLKKIGIDEWELVGDLASGVFSPASFSDLVVWNDGADPATILEADTPGFVSTWQDKSGNANDFVQATSSDQPTTGVATINGLNALGFDGDDDFLAVTSLALPASITFFLVMNVTASLTFDSVMGYTDPLVRGFNIRDGSVPNEFRAKFISNGLGATTNEPQSPTDLTGLDTLIVYRLSAGDGSVNLRINGVDIATDTYNGALASSGFFCIGRGSIEIFPVMTAGELVVYGRDVSLGEILAVESILKNKWGIA